MAASMSFTLRSRNRDFSRNLSFAVRMMIAGTSQVHPIFHLRALCLSGQRSFWQSAIRLTIHQPTNETTDRGTNLGRADVGEREPEFYAPVPPESAEQQSLLLARPSCQPKDARISRVAIVGTPNSGKSTLINSLLGRRICAVSPKVHTTMSKALAVITHRNTQVVLLDTPGLVSYTQGRRHKLSRSLLVDAKNTFLESDLVAVLVDVSNKWTNMKLDPEILIQLHTHSHIPSILVLNKVDALQTKQSLFEITEALTEGVVDGKEFVSPRRKGKLRSQMKDSVNSQRTNEMPGEENDVMKSDRVNAEALTGDDIEVTTVGSVLSSSSEHQTTNNPSGRENAVKEMRWTRSSVEEEDQSGLHVQDHDRFSNASASSELSSAYSKGNHTQSTGSHMTDHVTDDTSQVTEDNTVQSHDLDRTKRDIMQQYAANLLELSNDGDEAVARQHSEVDDEEMKEKEREMMEKQREERRSLWKIAKERSGWPGFKAVYMVSALHGDGVNDLKDFLLTSAKPGDWEYHEDVVTNLTPDEIVRDAIREKLLETLPEEVPYNISQSTELWQTGEGGELHIVQILICHKKSHVRMLEKKLGWIGRQVTQDLMDAFHCDVRLSLYVRFKK